jgi:hypothetical protein
MAIRMVEYNAEHIPAVKAFNSRMDQAGAGAFRLGEIAPDHSREYCDGVAFLHFLAMDGNGDVHGGYFMRLQPLRIRGQVRIAGQFASPLSEGIIDKRYAAVGPMLISHALKMQPLLFSSGMGGVNQPLPRMMKSLGWHVMEAPFFFRVIHGSHFLRNIGPLRKDTLRRLAADCLAMSGLGGLGIAAAQQFRTKASFDSRFQTEPLTEFGSWADEVWTQCQDEYMFSALRNSGYLRFNYPQTTSPYSGIKLMDRGNPVGWVNLLDCNLQNKSYFGAMKVAAIIDGVARRPCIPSLVAAAVRSATQNGADMVFSNQTHRDWIEALRNAGFWPGPSNYLLALSKELARCLEPLTEAIPLIHFNRGDGDGRVNLTGQA